MVKFLCALALLFGSVTVFGQAESNNPYTRDTAIVERASGPNFPHTWWVRITTQRIDRTPRPSIFNIQGAGEVGSDTNQLLIYGPHYLMANGFWDGSVKLGNGTHYPNVFTIMQPAVNQRPWQLNAIMDSLIKYYPSIDTTCIHAIGLSEGNWCWMGLITWYPSVGQFPGMKMIKSLVDLQGVEGENDFGAGVAGPGSGTAAQYRQAFGYWAKHYGGTFLGLEQDGDTRNEWFESQNMNDSVPGSAYFNYTHISNGSHCCWNSEYDPTVKNWTNVGAGAPGNSFLVLTTGAQPSTAGTYFFSATTGSNLFQWMLRQGDTSLRGNSGGTLPSANAGPTQTIQYPFQTAVAASGTATAGTGHSISSVSWAFTSLKVDGVTSSGVTPTISNPAILNPTITIPNACPGNNCSTGGVYSFTLTCTDNVGQQASSVLTVVDSNWKAPVASAGNSQTLVLPSSTTTLAGTATAFRQAVVASTVWSQTSGPNTATFTNKTVLGPTISALITGTYTFLLTVSDNNGQQATATTTVTVQASAAPSKKPRYVLGVGEYQSFGIDTLTGHVYGWGTNYQTIGTGGIGTLGTAIILALPIDSFFVFVAGGLHGGTAITRNGTVYAWGDTEQGQIGNGGVSGTPVTTPVRIGTDSAGAALPKIAYTVHYYAGNAAEGYYLVSQDSTKLYVVGYTALTGMKMVSYAKVTDTCKRPTLIPIPAGKKIMQVIAGNMVMVLFSDSTVYTAGNADINGNLLDWYDLGYNGTGTQWMTLHQLSTLSGVTQIFGGINFNGAVKSNNKLFGWGYYSANLLDGSASGAGVHWAVPTEMVNVENGLPFPVLVIKANSSNLLAILTDHSLWSWGDNAQGGVGIGSELNFFNTFYPTPATPTPFAWDFLPGDLLVTVPTRIGLFNDWIDITGSSVFTYYWLAQRMTGQAYSDGRNKGGVGMNNIIPCSSDQAAIYPNAWDITSPQEVFPTTAGTPKSVSCIWCGSHPSASACGTSSCPIPVLIVPGSVPYNKFRRKLPWH